MNRDFEKALESAAALDGEFNRRIAFRVDDECMSALPQAINCNFEEVREAILQATEKDRVLAVTAETMDYAKSRCATLNKMADQIEQKRKDVKKEWNDPYTAFEKKCKALVGVITEAREAIWAQVKAYEKAQSDEREEKFRDYYISTASEAVAHYFPYNAIRKEKWLNKTTKDDAVYKEIDEICEGHDAAIKTIVGMHYNAEAAVLRKYAETASLPMALSYAMLLETDRSVTETKKEEATPNTAEDKKSAQSAQERPTEDEEVHEIDFRVYATRTQLSALRVFLNENNIKYGKIPENK